MTVVALAILLLIPLATVGSKVETLSYENIAKTDIATTGSADNCRAVKPLPSLDLHQDNKCYVQGGHFLFDEKYVQWPNTPADCQAACRRKENKHCYNWRFMGGNCYVQVGSCANNEKYKADKNWEERSTMKSGAWIKDATMQKTVAGPRQCIGPEGCYRYGVWYNGKVVSGPIKKVADADACQTKCKQHGECKFFFYVTKGYISEVGTLVEEASGHSMEPGSCIMKKELKGSAYIVPGLVMGPKCCQGCPIISLLDNLQAMQAGRRQGPITRGR